MVPILRVDLPPTEPLTQRIPFDRAVHCVGKDGRLSIGLQRHIPSLAGPAFAYDWQMSLVLPGMPAGSERLYKVGGGEARAVQSLGGDHRRWRSVTGTATIRRAAGDRLIGRFHIAVQQQQFAVLSGWTSPARGGALVLVGEFESVTDARRTRAIVERTEQDGFERASAPAP